MIVKTLTVLQLWIFCSYHDNPVNGVYSQQTSCDQQGLGGSASATATNCYRSERNWVNVFSYDKDEYEISLESCQTFSRASINEIKSSIQKKMEATGLSLFKLVYVGLCPCLCSSMCDDFYVFEPAKCRKQAFEILPYDFVDEESTTTQLSTIIHISITSKRNLEIDSLVASSANRMTTSTKLATSKRRKKTTSSSRSTKHGSNLHHNTYGYTYITDSTLPSTSIVSSSTNSTSLTKTEPAQQVSTLGTSTALMSYSPTLAPQTKEKESAYSSDSNQVWFEPNYAASSSYPPSYTVSNFDQKSDVISTYLAVNSHGTLLLSSSSQKEKTSSHFAPNKSTTANVGATPQQYDLYRGTTSKVGATSSLFDPYHSTTANDRPMSQTSHEKQISQVLPSEKHFATNTTDSSTSCNAVLKVITSTLVGVERSSKVLTYKDTFGDSTNGSQMPLLITSSPADPQASTGESSEESTSKLFSSRPDLTANSAKGTLTDKFTSISFVTGESSGKTFSMLSRTDGVSGSVESVKSTDAHILMGFSKGSDVAVESSSRMKFTPNSYITRKSTEASSSKMFTPSSDVTVDSKETSSYTDFIEKESIHPSTRQASASEALQPAENIDTSSSTVWDRTNTASKSTGLFISEEQLTDMFRITSFPFPTDRKTPSIEVSESSSLDANGANEKVEDDRRASSSEETLLTLYTQSDALLRESTSETPTHEQGKGTLRQSPPSSTAQESVASTKAKAHEYFSELRSEVRHTSTEGNKLATIHKTISLTDFTDAGVTQAEMETPLASFGHSMLSSDSTELKPGTFEITQLERSYPVTNPLMSQTLDSFTHKYELFTTWTNSEMKDIIVPTTIKLEIPQKEEELTTAESFSTPNVLISKEQYWMKSSKTQEHTAILNSTTVKFGGMLTTKVQSIPTYALLSEHTPSSETSRPAYCNSTCPPNYVEGPRYCYRILPAKKSSSYRTVISYVSTECFFYMII